MAEIEKEKQPKEIEKEKQPKLKKYLVETPVKDFCGKVATIHFAHGKAEVYEGHILEWFKKKGYKVTEIK